MAQRSPSYRYRPWPRAAPIRTRRTPFRLLRRFLLGLIFLGLVFGVALFTVQHVYGPGMRAEVRTLPALVHGQLAQHNDAYVAVSAISPFMRQAIVAIEDRRFYHHHGIDPQGMVRALWINLTAQHVDQGGSTLDEQLVKLAIVHDDANLRGKLRTMALAWEADQEFTKSQILEMYLNEAYFGQGAYGIGQAARVYFGTDPAQLTLPEAAFLAALPQAPSTYGAAPSSGVVVARQDTVLDDMVQSGYITRQQADAARSAHLTFAFPNP